MLGVQWLNTLGPIVTDYSTLQMQFTWNNHEILLQGLSDSLEELSSTQLQRVQLLTLYLNFTIYSCIYLIARPTKLLPIFHL